jgi:hypothetical protein
MRQWIALGALAGYAGLIRWQNVLFALLPAVEVLVALGSALRSGDRLIARRYLLGGLAFTAAATVTFVPQMLAWKAIYGSYLAVSPLGPQIHWLQPQLADILFSSRNGLVAMSPVLYVAAIGLIGFAVRRPQFGVPVLAGIVAMTYFNASIHDWWGSDSYGGRRFDGVVPLLVPGLALAFEAMRDFVKRHPLSVPAAVAASLIVWNLTFIRSTEVPTRDAVSFRDVSAAQARLLHRWLGHPFTYPASLWFALRNGVPPAAYDVLRVARFLSDPTRPYGRIDIGVSDDVFVVDGWGTPEREGDVTFRRIGDAAVLLLPLDHAAPLDVQVRARASANPPQGPLRLRIDVNGRRLGPMDVPAEWTLVSIPTPGDAWRSGVNRLTLIPDPHEPGVARSPAVSIDYVRVIKPTN